MTENLYKPVHSGLQCIGMKQRLMPDVPFRELPEAECLERWRAAQAKMAHTTAAWSLEDTCLAKANWMRTQKFKIFTACVYGMNYYALQLDEEQIKQYSEYLWEHAVSISGSNT